jgi:capsular exopolysaccharide synthesis family protein
VDVEKATGMATLGIVPAFSQNGFSRGYGYGRGSVKVKIAAKNGDKRRRRKQERNKEKEVRQRGAMLQLGGGGSSEESRGPAGPSERDKTKSAATVPEPEVKSIELIAHLSPISNLAESYRTIRTSLLLSSADKKPKTIVVTSALPDEGKSATLCNLAVTLAQAGKTVLIVDSDFRRPTQHKIFKIRNINGLTNYLTSEMELKALVKETGIPKLYLINAGPVPPNPAELLGSEKMENLIESLKQWFDFILFDSPPLLAVSDAMVLGPKIDGIILVVWGGKTAKDALQQAKEKLDMLKVKCLGVVINNLKIQEHDYYYMHRHYHHYGEGKGGDKIT